MVPPLILASLRCKCRGWRLPGSVGVKWLTSLYCCHAAHYWFERRARWKAAVLLCIIHAQIPACQGERGRHTGSERERERMRKIKREREGNVEGGLCCVLEAHCVCRQACVCVCVWLFACTYGLKNEERTQTSTRWPKEASGLVFRIKLKESCLDIIYSDFLEPCSLFPPTQTHKSTQIHTAHTIFAQNLLALNMSVGILWFGSTEWLEESAKTVDTSLEGTHTQS